MEEEEWDGEEEGTEERASLGCRGGRGRWGGQSLRVLERVWVGEEGQVAGFQLPVAYSGRGLGEAEGGGAGGEGEVRMGVGEGNGGESE